MGRQEQPPDASVVSLQHHDPRESMWRAAADRCTERLSELLDNPPAVHLTPSCTHALEAAATILDLGPGDEVIVPAYSFPSAANPFIMRGAAIRFADIDPRTGNVTPDEVSRCVTSRTRAVVVVHYGGVACDLDPLVDLCCSLDAHLVEDAAHALFATYRGIPLGRFGSVGAFSFHRTKNVSSIDGGALVLNDPRLTDVLDAALDKGTNRRAFDRGEIVAYDWVAPGSSWRLSEPLAILLEEDLAASANRQTRRHLIWTRYLDELSQWASKLGVALPEVPDTCEHSAHLFWLRLSPGSRRDDFVAHCASHGVEVARHFGSLPHSPFGRTIADPDDRCPRALEFSEQVVRLPLHHDLADQEVDRVIEAVMSWEGLAG